MEAGAKSVPPREEGYVPPQNLDAEVSVLGALLVAPNLIAGVTEILRPQHFYRRSHGQVYEVVEDLYSQGEAVDPITVSEELSNRGSLEKVGVAPMFIVWSPPYRRPPMLATTRISSKRTISSAP